ncbi:MAG: hypothetical protein ACOYYI_08725, partial [Chloroflexota bacterium]
MNPIRYPRLFCAFLLLSILMGMTGMPMQIVRGAGTISLTGIPYTENFDTLASSGASSSVPVGWEFIETGTNANTTYTAGTGSNNTGDTYSFGSTGSPERAFGELTSASLMTTLGANFTNDTGAAITSMIIRYTGEQWRLGAVGRTDRLDFQYSMDAASLDTGTWVDVDALDFVAPVTGGTVGALDGNLSSNRTSMAYNLTGLTIANGSSFWIRWKYLDVSNGDDGLAVDDFSLIPNAMLDTSASDFSAGTVGSCVVDNLIGDGAVRLNLPGSTTCTFESRVFDA